MAYQFLQLRPKEIDDLLQRGRAAIRWQFTMYEFIHDDELEDLDIRFERTSHAAVPADGQPRDLVRIYLNKDDMPKIITSRAQYVFDGELDQCCIELIPRMTDVPTEYQSQYQDPDRYQVV